MSVPNPIRGHLTSIIRPCTATQVGFRVSLRVSLKQWSCDFLQCSGYACPGASENALLPYTWWQSVGSGWLEEGNISIMERARNEF